MSEIAKVTFYDYKRFEKFTLNCRRANILVGPNNSGKSSLLDSFRILFGALRFARRLRPKLVITANGEAWGYEIPDSSIPVSTAYVARNFGETAKIEFQHKNGLKLAIDLDADRATRLYLDGAYRHANTGKAYFSQFPIDLVVVPTLSPLEQEERRVSPETLEKNRISRLSSRVFRQIWYSATREEFDTLIVVGRRNMAGHHFDEA